HMLFMGSSEFTDENEYDRYLSRHGGSSNAYTETEHTCYYFEVNCKFLKPALKRFSQFFISPLVKAEAMEREVQAVDSEFDQVLQSDSCRLQQLQCHSAILEHPFNRFTWGNRKSLMEPMSKGVDMRAKILDLYSETYLAGRMKLSVIGGEPLDTLEEWVVEMFGNVRKGGLEKLNFHKDGPVWEPGRIFWVEAVRDLHVLKVTWPLPCLDKEYLKKAEDYLSHLIGHVEAVMQAKLIEECTRRDRELNLKVRGLPPPTPTQDPLIVGNSFITNTLGISDITLERAWVGYDSTLFISFRTTFDRLRALKARRVLFSCLDKVFFNEDLTRTQVGELKRSREKVMAARKAGKWAVIRNLRAVIRDSPPGWKRRQGAPQ
ncbi:hypothetical protein KI387_037633, partial [Taxus chinensis]